MSEQKICPTCGTEYPLSERFCPRDGTALRSTNTQDLLGAVVADRYHVLKKLGEGGMGTVYLAEHVKMGRKSALKVMNPGMNADPDAIARFNREASNASRLSHPNICGIYDFGETPDGLIYLAMEFIEGSSLTSLIEKSGSLPGVRAASIVHQTADALQVAHDAGIVHRDLKPDNIMVARNRDGSDLVKVVDFGIAKASSSDAQKVTKTGMVVGTPEYMSPEQLAGDKLDGRSDIYSLGLVAFNCLTGALPFPAETAQEAMILRLTDRPRTLAETRPDVAWPAALQATLDKALARDAEERYQSAAQFGREFAAAVSALPSAASTEAATQVMGAVSGGAAVPRTRVAEGRPSASTVPMEAPAAAKKPAARPVAPAAAPAKKSAMPAVLGGVGGLAVVGGLVWQFVLNKPGTDPGGAGDRPVSAESTVAKVPTPAAGDTTGTPPADPLNRPTGGDTPTKTAGGAGGTRPGGGTTGGGTTSGNDSKVPSGGGAEPLPAALTVTDAWIRRTRQELEVIDTETPSPSPAERSLANRVLRELEADQSRLQGATLASSWVVSMMAYAVLRDERGYCNSAKKVVDLSRNADELATARYVAGSCPAR